MAKEGYTLAPEYWRDVEYRNWKNMFPSMRRWLGCIWCIVYNSGRHTTGRMLMHWKGCWSDLLGCCLVWRILTMKKGWTNLACFHWSLGGWGATERCLQDYKRLGWNGSSEFFPSVEGSVARGPRLNMKGGKFKRNVTASFSHTGWWMPGTHWRRRWWK